MKTLKELVKGQPHILSRCNGVSVTYLYADAEDYKRLSWLVRPFPVQGYMSKISYLRPYSMEKRVFDLKREVKYECADDIHDAISKLDPDYSGNPIVIVGHGDRHKGYICSLGVVIDPEYLTTITEDDMKGWEPCSVPKSLGGSANGEE